MDRRTEPQQRSSLLRASHRITLQPPRTCIAATSCCCACCVEAFSSDDSCSACRDSKSRCTDCVMSSLRASASSCIKNRGGAMKWLSSTTTTIRKRCVAPVAQREALLMQQRWPLRQQCERRFRRPERKRERERHRHLNGGSGAQRALCLRWRLAALLSATTGGELLIVALLCCRMASPSQ